jgi:hypothetical protein
VESRNQWFFFRTLANFRVMRALRSAGILFRFNLIGLHSQSIRVADVKTRQGQLHGKTLAGLSVR